MTAELKLTAGAGSGLGRPARAQDGGAGRPARAGGEGAGRGDEVFQ